MQEIIRFDSVDLSYKNRRIFKDFSFEIERGDKVLVTGGSGSGKSSLLHLILGFAEPTGGSVFFNGRVVDERTVWDLRRKISFVDQEVSTVQGSVGDWFDFASRIKANRTVGFKKQKILSFFKYFEMEESLLSSNIGKLSGGERQRVALIISLLLGRKIFLLDEVTSSLDKKLRKKVIDLFSTAEDLTVLAVSHDHVWVSESKFKIFDLESKRWIR